MKLSIITAVKNSVTTIEDCIRSVSSQSYNNIEHIIIDGGSTDGTLDVIKKYTEYVAKIISEPDNGIYDALNKGIRLASGDIIGILHADDVYADNKVIETVVKIMSDNNVDSCYGDLVYVDRNGVNRIIRYWVAGDYLKEKFRRGWMPPHPTFFVRSKFMRNLVFLILVFF